MWSRSKRDTRSAAETPTTVTLARPSVWFRSIFLKSLRDYRIAIFGWGVGFGLLTLVVIAAVPSLISTPAARASLVTLGSSFAWIADPIRIDTPGGYLTWKYGFTILLIAIWPLLVGSRMLRGEEERGSLDVLLAAPRSRLRVALEKLAAMWVALLAMGLLIALLTFAGGAKETPAIGFADALLFGLNISLISALFGSIALLLSQFTLERGTASGITGALLVISILVDMVHRVIPNTEWLSRLSPVYYYNLSKPVVPGQGANAGAMLFLFGLSIVLSGAAIWLFAVRDVGGTVPVPSWLRLPQRAMTPQRALPEGAWSLRSVYTRSLRMLAFPTLWWTLGIAGFGAFTVVIVKQSEATLAKLLSSSPAFAGILGTLGGGNALTNAGLMSAIFSFLPLVLMAFAITQASHWSSDEEDGRLELVLATPQPRVGVLLGRFGALTTALIVIGLLTLAATGITSLASGLTLDGGNLTVAALSMVPLGLLVAAIGYALSGWLRTAVDTGLLSFVLVIWFFITDFGPSLKWSDAALRLSALYYYGSPLLHGLNVGNLLILLAVGAVALALATVRFARKDIGR
jgi:ABC-2 type transport system permease protein